MPLRDAGIRVDCQIRYFREHPVGQFPIGVDRVQRDRLGQGPLTTIQEHQFAARISLARETAFVHQAMMMPAELHQIVETGLAAVGPVLDVVPVDKALERTAGKAAAVIPGPQCTSYRRRYRARLATNG